jgi:esterase/lipase
MHGLSKNIMQRYMQAIYTMTTVNHDHLFASFLRLYPYRHIKISDLKRRVFYAASLLRDLDGKGIFLHQSLQGSQTHLVTDDRYGKFANFLELALDKGVLQQRGQTLLQDRSKLSKPISFHRGRIDNPIEVIANEAEPLHRLRGVLHSLAWQPDFLLRINLIRHLLRRERHCFRHDFNRFAPSADRQRVVDGMPFLFSSLSRKIGVVLVHSYLSVPGEVRDLARFLNRLGYWVYAPRLPGHGTSPADLASRTTVEWLEAVETGFAIMQDICDRVVLGGMSVGGSLALQLAASTVRAAGLFAICPPMRLKDYSTRFMPAQDTWDRMLSRMKGENLRSQFVDFSSDNPHINYSRNPLSGISEVGSLLERLEKTVRDITLPILILQADNDPVLSPKSARLIFDRLASAEKEFSLVHADRNIIINGEGAERVHRKIGTFIRELR